MVGLSELIGILAISLEEKKEEEQEGSREETILGTKRMLKDHVESQLLIVKDMIGLIDKTGEIMETKIIEEIEEEIGEIEGIEEAGETERGIKARKDTKIGNRVSNSRLSIDLSILFNSYKSKFDYISVLKKNSRK